MIFQRPFRVFDPLLGRSPMIFEHRFRDVLVRARRIVAPWDNDDIKTATDLMDWLLVEHIRSPEAAQQRLRAIANDAKRKEDQPRKLNPLIQWDPSPSDSELDRLDYPSFCRPLFAKVPELGIPESDAIKDVTWAKLFATASIAFVGDCCTLLEFRQRMDIQDGVDPLAPDEVYLHDAGHGLAQALEAVCFAEFLEHFESTVESAAKDYWRRESTKHAARRHAKGNAIKRRFLEFHDENQFPTAAAAIRAFEETLPSDEATSFADLPRMLRTALAERKREY